MLVVDTRSARTMISEKVFEEHFAEVGLQRSSELMCLANGEKLRIRGQMCAQVQVGPAAAAMQQVTVANVIGDGILGMDYLIATDGGVGMKEGELYMQLNRYKELCRPITEGQVAGTVTDSVAQSMVPHKVGCVGGGLKDLKLSESQNEGSGTPGAAKKWQENSLHL